MNGLSIGNSSGDGQGPVYKPCFLAEPQPGENAFLSLSGHLLPRSKAAGHSLTIGMTGTGKTLMMRASIGFAASTLGTYGGSLIDFDAKGEDFPLLSFFAKRQGVPLYFLNLGDQRSWALDVAKDAQAYPDYLWELALLL
jgi:hypothetical protein